MEYHEICNKLIFHFFASFKTNIEIHIKSRNLRIGRFEWDDKKGFDATFRTRIENFPQFVWASHEIRLMLSRIESEFNFFLLKLFFHGIIWARIWNFEYLQQQKKRSETRIFHFSEGKYYNFIRFGLFKSSQKLRLAFFGAHTPMMMLMTRKIVYC